MFRKVFKNSHEAQSEITLGSTASLRSSKQFENKAVVTMKRPSSLSMSYSKSASPLSRRGRRRSISSLPGMNLPFIGYRSHLGQVIMNLLSNGIDAAEEFVRPDEAPPEVILGFTRSSRIISMCGFRTMVRECPRNFVRKCLPHFTTKPSGKGTGLGILSS